MPLDHDLLMGLSPIRTEQSYSARDSMLYALGVGAGLGDPTDPMDLPFVYEKGLKALPTMAAVMTYPGAWLADPRLNLNYKQLLHGEQSLTIHHPLPAAADLVGLTRVEAIYDKGAAKGALLYSTREISDRRTGERIATVGMGYFLRGDGGFGGSSDGAPAPRRVPDRAPDVQVQLATRPEQALLYRLSGDYNPLHADPAAASEAGFARPILHGLCTYGVAGRGVMRILCRGEAERLKRFDVRFTSPVYPGETLEVDLWREGPGQAALRCRAVERNQYVLQHGYVEYEV